MAKKDCYFYRASTVASGGFPECCIHPDTPDKPKCSKCNLYIDRNGLFPYVVDMSRENKKKLEAQESSVTTSQIVASWYETEPRPIKDYVDSTRYVTAICRCPVPLTMGIVIDKEKCISDDGWYHFRCTKCGLRGKVYG